MLHRVIDSEEAGVRDERILLDDPPPANPERDHDLDWAREVLFRDHNRMLPLVATGTAPFSGQPPRSGSTPRHWPKLPV